MNIINEFKLTVDSKSINESFCRVVVSSFITPLDPTIDEISDLKTAVSEAVTNCIVHAYKDTYGKINITGVITDDNIVKIKIKDNGIGIPESEQQRIFERFYRVDKSHSRETGGTGLGLSIVKHGAVLHHAKILLDSEPGKGTKKEILFNQTK